MKLLQFLQEDNGNFSSSRLLSFLVTIALVVDWQHAVWTAGVWHPDLNLVLILLTVVTGKVVQKFGESETKKEVSIT
jgi:hypothetical protein